MTAPVRFPRFFVTAPSPCPYLAGKSERKVFTELRGENADELNEALGRIGFRRSQTVAYRLFRSSRVAVSALGHPLTAAASESVFRWCSLATQEQHSQFVCTSAPLGTNRRHPGHQMI